MNADFVDLLWLFAPPKTPPAHSFLPIGIMTWNKSSTEKNIIGIELQEAGLLYKYAKQQWKKIPKTNEGNIILEIGRYWGGSTVLLATATHNSDVKIVSVDVVDGCLDSDTGNWLNNYEEKERIDIRVSNSQTMENLPLSMLFVDGDHTYDGFKKDILHHWNYLNGPCLCHDYGNPFMPGVTTFVNEFVKDGYAEIIECINSLIVLRKLKDV
jgi:hypothetical protein